MQKLNKVGKDMMRCVRCQGRKKVYKIMGGYSLVNSGGVHTDCPLCLGKGEVMTIEKAIEEGVKSLSKITDEEAYILRKSGSKQKVKKPLHIVELKEENAEL